jgi:hypothetical protein
MPLITSYRVAVALKERKADPGSEALRVNPFQVKGEGTVSTGEVAE